MVLGSGIIIYGFNNLPQLVSNAFGLLHIAFGFYFITRGSVEIYKDLEFKKPKWIKKNVRKGNKVKRRK